jgi:hypothetical protein
MLPIRPRLGGLGLDGERIRAEHRLLGQTPLHQPVEFREIPQRGFGRGQFGLGLRDPILSLPHLLRGLLPGLAEILARKILAQPRKAQAQADLVKLREGLRGRAVNQRSDAPGRRDADVAGRQWPDVRRVSDGTSGIVRCIGLSAMPLRIPTLSCAYRDAPISAVACAALVIARSPIRTWRLSRRAIPLYLIYGRAEWKAGARIS